MTYKKMENYVALQDHFLIEPTEDKLKSASGLVTTQLHKSVIDKPSFGIVKGIGEKVTCDVEVGDFVYWPYTAGIYVELDGIEHVVLAEKNILLKKKK